MRHLLRRPIPLPDQLIQHLRHERQRRCGIAGVGENLVLELGVGGGLLLGLRSVLGDVFQEGVHTRRRLRICIGHPSIGNRRYTLVHIRIVSGRRKAPRLMVDLLGDDSFPKERPGEVEAAVERVRILGSAEALGLAADPVLLEPVDEGGELIGRIGNVRVVKRGGMAGIRPPQRVRIHGGNPDPPIQSEVIPQLLCGHVQGGGGWDPKQAMIMTCSPSLPLGSMPKVLETEERTKHVLGEGFESQVQVSRDDMRVSLHVLPHDLLPDLLSGRSIDVILWEVPLEVLPLHVGTAEGQKDRCLVPRQKARLCLEGIAFVPPEWASPGQL